MQEADHPRQPPMGNLTIPLENQGPCRGQNDVLVICFVWGFTGEAGRSVSELWKPGAHFILQAPPLFSFLFGIQMRGWQGNRRGGTVLQAARPPILNAAGLKPGAGLALAGGQRSTPGRWGSEAGALTSGGRSLPSLQP